MTIYTIAYNEEFFLPYFINHYRSRFKNCRIVIYDNESTDNTNQIAAENNCEIRTFYTDGKLNDEIYIQIKNNCWKEIEGWVIICDIDELLDISQTDIDIIEAEKTGLIKSKGYNMVNINDNMDIASIAHGIRSHSYDKLYCFDTRIVYETNYEPGCHKANPISKLKTQYYHKPFICYHYKYINLNYMIKRHTEYAKRLSETNLKYGYGGHYLYSSNEISREFKNAQKEAIKILH